MSQKKAAAFIFLFYLLCYVVPLGARDLAIPDETRYGEIPREMLSDGDWISPRLNGVRYFEKPVLGYWLHAVSIGILGENNFAVRFPSVFAVGLTALALYFFIRHVGTGLRGETAVLIYLSSFGVFVTGNIAVLDSVFSFFTTLSSILFFLWADAESEGRRKTLLGISSGFFCACAFLTKGFLALAIPTVVFVPYFFWTRSYRELRRACILPLVVATLVILPWGVCIHLEEPDFWRFFFWNEHIRRFMSENAQHARSFWFFFAVGPLMTLPWSFLTPSVFVGMASFRDYNERLKKTVKFCVCWLLFPFLFFSFSRGKLPTYILPCLPPFAVLVTLGLTRPTATFERRRKKAFKWGILANMVLFFAATLLLFYVQFWREPKFVVYSKAYQFIILVNSLLFFVLLSAEAVKSRDSIKKIWRVALAPLLLFVSVHFLIPDLTTEIKMPWEFLQRYVSEVNRDTVIITDEDLVGAVCWYLKRNDVYILGGAGELDYGFDYEDTGRHVDTAAAVRLIAGNAGNVVLIAKTGIIERMKDQLPSGFVEYKSVPSGYLLWRKY
jgi:4-amino-4-deoxy-L-arabinose transferase